MTVEELNRRLCEEGIVRLRAAEWAQLAEHYEVVERHDTLVAGDLLIVRHGGETAAVEQPAASERVVRRLAGAGEARELVRERLEAYERMWDGCGCKIDYYK